MDTEIQLNTATLEEIHPASCDAARGIFSHVMRTFLLILNLPTTCCALNTNG
jgi:hypothetical protein